MLQAIQAAGKSDDILLTSYDGEQEACDYVGTGEFGCTLLTGSKRVGYWNVKVAYDLASGEKLDPMQHIASYFVIGDKLSEQAQALVDSSELEESRILNAEEGRAAFDDYSDYKPAQ